MEELYDYIFVKGSIMRRLERCWRGRGLLFQLPSSISSSFLNFFFCRTHSNVLFRATGTPVLDFW